MTRLQAISAMIVSGLGGIAAIVATNRFCWSNEPLKEDIQRYRDHVSEIAELIIPRTDSPGAKDAAVQDYIIGVIINCSSARDGRVFVGGLEELENYSFKHFSNSFLHCSLDNRTSILSHFEKKGSFSNSYINKVKQKLLGPSFFELIKRLTITGYCSSKLGATQGLVYDKVPFRYVACEPYTPLQRAWALK